jgi:hypothetical protein
MSRREGGYVQDSGRLPGSSYWEPWADHRARAPRQTGPGLRATALKSRPAIEVALRRRFSNPATVQDCLELLARLEGELP